MKAPVLLCVVSSLLLCSCGNVTYFAGDNAAGTGGMAVGPVAGFGSVKAGGAAFAVDNATTVLDDLGRTIDNVVEGMIVTVRGTLASDFKTGTAASVAIERELRGPVDDNGVHLDNNILAVLGQTVLVNPSTVLWRSDNVLELSDLANDVDNNALRPELEVHGWRDDRDFLHATFVGRGRDNVVADDNVALRGNISGFNGTTRTFAIGGQKVNYTGLPADSGQKTWPITGLANGLVVDVRGRLDAVGGSGTVRTDRAGDRLEVQKISLGNPKDRVTLEGYVVSGSTASFVLSVPGGSVTVNGGVPTTGGTFGIGKRVQVKGSVTGSDGTHMQATAIAVRVPNQVLMEGSPTAFDLSGNTMTLLGGTVETDPFTIFRDATGAVRTGFGLASLTTGDTVRVVGAFDNTVPPGKVAATRVERLSATPADNVTLQGPVSSFGVPLLSILGVQVRTDFTNTGYFDRGGVPFADQIAFFTELAIRGAGTVVKVTGGIFTGGPPRVNPPTSGNTMEVEIVQVNN